MRDRRWLTLTLLATAQFMVVLDLTIVNVALPHIQAALGFSADGLQWVVSAYTLLFGGFLLLGGRAADLLGRRAVFSAGLGLFRAGVAGRRAGHLAGDDDRRAGGPGARWRAAVARGPVWGDRHLL